MEWGQGATGFGMVRLWFPTVWQAAPGHVVLGLLFTPKGRVQGGSKSRDGSGEVGRWVALKEVPYFIEDWEGQSWNSLWAGLWLMTRKKMT